MEYTPTKKYIAYHFLINTIDIAFIITCFDSNNIQSSSVKTPNEYIVISCFNIMLLLRLITNLCDWASWIRIVQNRSIIFNNYEIFRRWIYIQPMFITIYRYFSVYNILHICESFLAIILSIYNKNYFDADLNQSIQLVYIAGYSQMVRLIIQSISSFGIFRFPYYISGFLQPIDAVCSLCQNYSYESEITIKCGHQYHRHCAHVWFQRNSRCPICREFVLFCEY